MKFFKSLFAVKENQPTSCLIQFKEFSNSDCRCVQQELDLSETEWMDTSAYKNAKEVLRKQSVEAINAQINSKKQRDLFGF
jgi:hypothetical protein